MQSIQAISFHLHLCQHSDSPRSFPRRLAARGKQASSTFLVSWSHPLLESRTCSQTWICKLLCLLLQTCSLLGPRLDRPNRSEDDCGYVAVVHLQVCSPVEYSFSNDAPCFYRYRSELNVVSDISNRIDTWDICVLILVNCNCSVWLEVDSYLF
jgi:hypothetical protein